MKLLSFKIKSNYRNLKNLNIDFSKGPDTQVIIGNNGTGKSNILEAISHVFSVLYANEDNFDFSFILRYEIDGCLFRIQHEKGVTSYKKGPDKDSVDILRNELVLPKRIICTYSGEDDRIWVGQYKAHHDKYMESIKSDTAALLNMMYVDKRLWKEILLCMLCRKDEVTAFNEFLVDMIGIDSCKDIEVTLSIDENVTSRWKKQNLVTVFLDNLRRGFGGVYTLVSKDLKKFNPDDLEARDLFMRYTGASLAFKNIDIKFNNEFEASFLSEGEKKMMVIIFILEALADENTLVLMDEPDSHIHIARKSELSRRFLDMVNRNNILTSHSPSLTASFEAEDKNSVVMLKNSNGKTVVIPREEINLVESLTEGIWTAQQRNLFLASSNDILLLEGPTDETYISCALQHFKIQNKFKSLNFEYLPCGGADNVKNFVSKFIPKENQLMIAIFDADNAGMTNITKLVPLKGKKKTGEKSDSEKIWTPKEFGKAKKQGRVWYAIYPQYRKKGIKNFNVEDYFSRNLFTSYILSFNSLDTIRTKEGLKKKLADDCKNGVEKVKKCFKNFSVLFDLIQEIKQAEKEGKTEI